MPSFRITAPDGTVYNVTGPDGSTEQDALGQVQAQHAPQQASTLAPTFDTAVDSAARGLPPLSAQTIRRTGFSGQVSDAFSGASAPGPIQAPTMAELGRQYGHVAKGVAIGSLAGVPGTGGDIEGLLRLIPSKLELMSPNTILPTSSQVGDIVAGPTKSPEEAAGRIIGNFLSPGLLIKTLGLSGKIAGTIAANTLGVTTGAGGAAIKEGFQAGKMGGTASQAFLDNLRGNAPFSDVVGAGKRAVAQMRADKNASYKTGIGSTIKGDPQVLDFAPIDQAINDVANIGSFQGKSLSSGADKVRQKIQEVVSDWKSSDPTIFHTPEGLDALKQKIGNLGYEEDLKAVAGPQTPGKAILDASYNAIKGQIVQSAPGYANVMRDYMNASDELRNIEGSLSLGKNANMDTSLRKLQSILRNNANTNYGERVKMGGRLVDSGADTLMPSLSGQALSAVAPRGIATVGDISALGGAALAGHPGALALASLTSPRVVGEAAHLFGRLSPNANKGSAIAGVKTGISGVTLPSDPKLRALMMQQILARLALPQNQSH